MTTARNLADIALAATNAANAAAAPPTTTPATSGPALASAAAATATTNQHQPENHEPAATNVTAVSTNNGANKYDGAAAPAPADILRHLQHQFQREDSGDEVDYDGTSNNSLDEMQHQHQRWGGTMATSSNNNNNDQGAQKKHKHNHSASRLSNHHLRRRRSANRQRKRIGTPPRNIQTYALASGNTANADMLGLHQHKKKKKRRHTTSAGGGLRAPRPRKPQHHHHQPTQHIATATLVSDSQDADAEIDHEANDDFDDDPSEHQFALLMQTATAQQGRIHRRHTLAHHTSRKNDRHALLLHKKKKRKKAQHQLLDNAPVRSLRSRRSWYRAAGAATTGQQHTFGARTEEEDDEDSDLVYRRINPPFAAGGDEDDHVREYEHASNDYDEFGRLSFHQNTITRAKQDSTSAQATAVTDAVDQGSAALPVLVRGVPANNCTLLDKGGNTTAAAPDSLYGSTKSLYAKTIPAATRHLGSMYLHHRMFGGEHFRLHTSRNRNADIVLWFEQYGAAAHGGHQTGDDEEEAYKSNGKHDDEKHPTKQTTDDAKGVDSSKRGRLFWCSAMHGVGRRVRRTAQSIAVKDISSVLYGKQTRIWMDAVDGSSAQRAAAHCCFSILTESSSLDLEAPSWDVRDGWVAGLRVLLETCVKQSYVVDDDRQGMEDDDAMFEDGAAETSDMEETRVDGGAVPRGTTSGINADEKSIHAKIATGAAVAAATTSPTNTADQHSTVQYKVRVRLRDLDAPAGADRVLVACNDRESGLLVSQTNVLPITRSGSGVYSFDKPLVVEFDPAFAQSLAFSVYSVAKGISVGAGACFVGGVVHPLHSLAASSGLPMTFNVADRPLNGRVTGVLTLTSSPVPVPEDGKQRVLPIDPSVCSGRAGLPHLVEDDECMVCGRSVANMNKCPARAGMRHLVGSDDTCDACGTWVGKAASVRPASLSSGSLFPGAVGVSSGASSSRSCPARAGMQHFVGDDGVCMTCGAMIASSAAEISSPVPRPTMIPAVASGGATSPSSPPKEVDCQEFRIQCLHLVHPTGGVSEHLVNAMVAVNDAVTKKLLADTEVCFSTPDPVFKTKLVIKQKPGQSRVLRLTVYHVDDELLSSHASSGVAVPRNARIGYVEVSVGAIFDAMKRGHQGGQILFPLDIPGTSNELSSRLRAAGSCIVFTSAAESEVRKSDVGNVRVTPEKREQKAAFSGLGSPRIAFPDKEERYKRVAAVLARARAAQKGVAPALTKQADECVDDDQKKEGQRLPVTPCVPHADVESEGMFELVLKGRRLPRSTSRKADPVIAVNETRTGSLLGQTEWIKGKQNPNFSQRVRIWVVPGSGESITFNVFDVAEGESVSEDNMIGTVSAKIDDVIAWPSKFVLLSLGHPNNVSMGRRLLKLKSAVLVNARRIETSASTAADDDATVDETDAFSALLASAKKKSPPKPHIVASPSPEPAAVSPPVQSPLPKLAPKGLCYYVSLDVHNLIPNWQSTASDIIISANDGRTGRLLGQTKVSSEPHFERAFTVRHFVGDHQGVKFTVYYVHEQKVTMQGRMGVALVRLDEMRLSHDNPSAKFVVSYPLRHVKDVDRNEDLIEAGTTMTVEFEPMDLPIRDDDAAVPTPSRSPPIGAAGSGRIKDPKMSARRMVSKKHESVGVPLAAKVGSADVGAAAKSGIVVVPNAGSSADVNMGSRVAPSKAAVIKEPARDEHTPASHAQKKSEKAVSGAAESYAQRFITADPTSPVARTAVENMRDGRKCTLVFANGESRYVNLFLRGVSAKPVLHWCEPDVCDTSDPDKKCSVLRFTDLYEGMHPGIFPEVDGVDGDRALSYVGVPVADSSTPLVQLHVQFCTQMDRDMYFIGVRYLLHSVHFASAHRFFESRGTAEPEQPFRVHFKSHTVLHRHDMEASPSDRVMGVSGGSPPMKSGEAVAGGDGGEHDVHASDSLVPKVDPSSASVSDKVKAFASRSPAGFVKPKKLGFSAKKVAQRAKLKVIRQRKGKVEASGGITSEVQGAGGVPLSGTEGAVVAEEAPPPASEVGGNTPMALTDAETRAESHESSGAAPDVGVDKSDRGTSRTLYMALRCTDLVCASSNASGVPSAVVAVNNATSGKLLGQTECKKKTCNPTYTTHVRIDDWVSGVGTAVRLICFDVPKKVRVSRMNCVGSVVFVPDSVLLHSGAAHPKEVSVALQFSHKNDVALAKRLSEAKSTVHLRLSFEPFADGVDMPANEAVMQPVPSDAVNNLGTVTDAAPSADASSPGAPVPKIVIDPPPTEMGQQTGARADGGVSDTVEQKAAVSNVEHGQSANEHSSRKGAGKKSYVRVGVRCEHLPANSVLVAVNEKETGKLLGQTEWTNGTMSPVFERSVKLPRDKLVTFTIYFVHTDKEGKQQPISMRDRLGRATLATSDYETADRKSRGFQGGVSFSRPIVLSKSVAWMATGPKPLLCLYPPNARSLQPRPQSPPKDGDDVAATEGDGAGLASLVSAKSIEAISGSDGGDSRAKEPAETAGGNKRKKSGAAVRPSVVSSADDSATFPSRWVRLSCKRLCRVDAGGGSDGQTASSKDDVNPLIAVNDVGTGELMAQTHFLMGNAKPKFRKPLLLAQLKPNQVLKFNIYHVVGGAILEANRIGFALIKSSDILREGSLTFVSPLAHDDATVHAMLRAEQAQLILKVVQPPDASAATGMKKGGSADGASPGSLVDQPGSPAPVIPNGQKKVGMSVEAASGV